MCNKCVVILALALVEGREVIHMYLAFMLSQM